MIVEITDTEAKINGFLPVLHDLFEQARSGGLVTLEKVEIIRYTHGGSGQSTGIRAQ